MRRYEVSSRVNVVKYYDVACAEPVVRLAWGDVSYIGNTRLTLYHVKSRPPFNPGADAALR